MKSSRANTMREETQEIDNPIAKKHYVVHTCGWYLPMPRPGGATPIVCTQVPRKTWKEGRIVRSDDTYGK
jgi:hypothetical protein